MTVAVWAWIGLAVLIAGWVLGFDLWAQATGHPTMSAQFHVWMQDQLTGPIVVAAWSAVSAGFIYHFLINK
jgi:hypothetical protein